MDRSFYVFVFAIAALVLWRRTRSFYRPIRGDGKRLLYPILFMLPGLLLIFNSNVHAPFYEFLIAAAIGIILSIPLIWTTNYEIRDDHLYTPRRTGDSSSLFSLSLPFVSSFTITCPQSNLKRWLLCL